MGVVETIFGGSPIEIIRDAFLTTPTQFVPLRLFTFPISSTLLASRLTIETIPISSYQSATGETLDVTDDELDQNIEVVYPAGSTRPYRVYRTGGNPYYVTDIGDTILIEVSEPTLLFEFYRNPRECSIQGPTKLNTKIITEAAVFFQFWGNDTYEITMAGSFGAMLPQNLFISPQDTAAYKAFAELRRRFEEDHQDIDNIIDYLVSLQFEEDIYSGVLQKFSYTLHQELPYQIEYTLTMEALVRDTDLERLSSGLSRRNKLANPHRLPPTTEERLNDLEYEFPLNVP